MLTLPRSLALVMLLFATPATAGPPPGAKHTAYSAFAHNGFLMRLAVGFGYTRASQESPLTEVVLSGGGAFGSFAFGAMIAPNLALNLDLFGTSALGPAVAVNGVDLGDAENTTMSLGALGIGLTYYLMPANIYLAASIGGATGRLETRDGDAVYRSDSDLGVAVNLMVGKEWWVGREWGLGLAGQFIFASLPGDSADIKALGAGVLFSATWN